MARKKAVKSKTSKSSLAKYALRDIHKPIGVAGCETKLVESLTSR